MRVCMRELKGWFLFRLADTLISDLPNTWLSQVKLGQIKPNLLMQKELGFRDYKKVENIAVTDVIRVQYSHKTDQKQTYLFSYQIKF